MSVAQERVPGPAALQRRGRFRPGDAVLYVVTLAAALSGVVLLALITREVLTEAWPAMQKFGLHFLTTQAWGDKHDTLFGAKSFIFGTVVTSLGALLLATPISRSGRRAGKSCGASSSPMRARGSPQRSSSGSAAQSGRPSR